MWTSIFGLPLIRQPTLIIAGRDDPIIPAINPRIMSKLLPNATVLWHPGGHIDPVVVPEPFAREIDVFLGSR